ncbi:MAG: thermonuclease family protein [bacterium]
MNSTNKKLKRNINNRWRWSMIIAIIAIVAFLILLFFTNFSIRSHTISSSETSRQMQEDTNILGELVKVKNVIDGDTIELDNGRRVRYIGIDAPELNGHGEQDDEYLASAARERNLVLLESGKKIILIEDSGANKDKYGRLLRYVYSDNLFLNKVLAREGFAKIFICREYMENCPVMNDLEKIRDIESAAEEAQTEKRGIFAKSLDFLAKNLRK